MAIEQNDLPNRGYIDQYDANKIIVEEQNTHVEVSLGGPQGQRGPTGPTGPRGEGGLTREQLIAVVSYFHDQTTPLATWTITHSLGFKPNVSVFDSADTMVEGEIVHNDENLLTITFSAAFSGKAYLS